MAIDTLGANALASNSVTTAKIAADAVTSAKIPAGAVGNTEVASGVSASKLTTGTLPTAQLAAGTVLQTKFINATPNSTPVTFTVTGAVGGGGLHGGSQGNRTYNQAGSTITITPRATSSKLMVYATVYWTFFNSVATTGHGCMVSLNDSANTGGTGANPALESGDYPWYTAQNVTSGIYWPPQTITGTFSPPKTKFNSFSTYSIKSLSISSCKIPLGKYVPGLAISFNIFCLASNPIGVGVIFKFFL